MRLDGGAAVRQEQRRRRGGGSVVASCAREESATPACGPYSGRGGAPKFETWAEAEDLVPGADSAFVSMRFKQQGVGRQESVDDTLAYVLGIDVEKR
jgi:hypothetical protein